MSYEETLAAIPRLTEAQREALIQIALDNDSGHNRRTLAVLLQKGLIERHDERRLDRLGAFTVFRYSTPLAVHMAVCQWCTGQHQAGLL